MSTNRSSQSLKTSRRVRRRRVSRVSSRLNFCAFARTVPNPKLSSGHLGSGLLVVLTFNFELCVQESPSSVSPRAPRRLTRRDNLEIPSLPRSLSPPRRSVVRARTSTFEHFPASAGPMFPSQPRRRSSSSSSRAASSSGVLHRRHPSIHPSTHPPRRAGWENPRMTSRDPSYAPSRLPALSAVCPSAARRRRVRRRERVVDARRRARHSWTRGRPSCSVRARRRRRCASTRTRVKRTDEAR